MLGVGLLAGPANVIMQLSRPGVGYGVMESRVESGRIDRHPIKRARTTFTYLAVSVNGTPAAAGGIPAGGERCARAGVFDRREPGVLQRVRPELQMWVGACMYKGVVDIYKIFVGEIDDQTAEQLFEEGIALGTMLQVPREMWPADQAAFDRYWDESMAQVHIDDEVRDFLWPIAAGRVRGAKLPACCAAQAGRLQPVDHGRFPAATVPRRDAAGLGRREAAPLRPVDEAHSVRQRPAADASIRQFPFNWMLKDLDWRIRTGRPLV